MSGSVSPIHSLKIGNVSLENNIILGPMAGVTDPPFRQICSEMGAGLVCMEMVSAKAIYYKNKKTSLLLKVYPDERPVSLQLFGSDPDCMSEVISDLTVEGSSFDLIDINMGCPVPKIVKNGEGSALMREPDLVARIVESCVRASRVPVTVKMRSGFDAYHINAPEIARICEDSGAAAVAVHARTREQYYSGEPDYSVIASVKEAVTIPVIGNGNISSYSDVVSMYEQTGCDGFMVARASQGNPWVFRQILSEGTEGKKISEPQFPGICEMAMRHAAMLCEEKGEYIGMREMRKHSAWYVAGYPNAVSMRRSFNTVESLKDLENILLQCKTSV